MLNDICRCRQDVDRRQSIVTLFLARFTLSEDEIESLVSGDVPIGRRFFDAMDNNVILVYFYYHKARGISEFEN